MLGLYVPGSSLLHRVPAGVKLAGLAAVLLALTVVRSPAAVVVAAALVVLLAWTAQVGARAFVAQVRPVAWVAVMVAVVQAWAGGWQPAVVAAGALLVAVAAAGLVTLTTPMHDLLDAVVAFIRPLRRVGVDPERVGLVLAMAIRSVPVIAALAREVRDARAARGAQRSVRAFAVPLVIRTVRHADRLGEALAARGVDD